jgi:DNA-directed RNA polymerase specialized sigma24 family protein
MTLSSYKRHSIHCLHQYGLLLKRQIATTLDLPRTTVKETLDRGLTLERPGFIPEI